MTIPVLLAHGTLGNWDEMIFLGVVVIFVGMIGISWVRSRAIEPDFDEEEQIMINEAKTSDEDDRFRLD